MTNKDIVHTDLSSLVSYYEKECFERVLKIEETGVSPSWLLSAGTKEEVDILESIGFYSSIESKQFYEFRRLAFNQLLLRKLRVINSYDPELLECLDDVVRDPYLDAAFEWLRSSGGLKCLNDVDSVDTKNFVASVDFRDVVRLRRFSHYARPIILLDLLLRHPNLKDTLSTDSTFAVYENFENDSSKIPSLRDVEKRVASNITEFFSEDILERIKKVDEYIKAKDKGASGFNRFNGKYKIPESTLYWTRKDDVSRDELRNLYEDHEVKRELFTILAQCFVLMRDSVDDAKKKRKDLKHSKFRVQGGNSGFTMLMDALTNYTINQLVYCWRSSEGKVIPETYLGKFRRLKARRVGSECLEINYFRMGAANIKFSLRSNNYLGTSSTLPYIAFTLNQWYNLAVTINKPNPT